MSQHHLDPFGAVTATEQLHEFHVPWRIVAPIRVD